MHSSPSNNNNNSTNSPPGENSTNSTATPTSPAPETTTTNNGITITTPSVVNTSDEKNNNSKEPHTPHTPSLTMNLEIVGILILNVCSVVGIVGVNKKIFQTEGFQFPSTLMSLHFLVTYLFVLVFHKVGYFQAKKIETKQYAKLGAAQVGSVALVNLSLVYNDVGTYQLMKFLVIFVTCILEYLFYRKVYSLQVYLVLGGLVLSISLATITSLAPSMSGILFGLGGALGTSYYQILNKHIQSEFQVAPLQLLHYEQPWSAGWCFLFASLTEPVGNIFTMEWPPQLVFLVALSAVCAFGVNVSVYLIIGKTGPITYSVLGHVKTISIFAIGILFLGDKFAHSQAFWMSVAFVMIVLYGHVGSGAPAPQKKVDEQNNKNTNGDKTNVSEEKKQLVGESEEK